MSLWTNSRSLRETINGYENNYTLIRAFLAASVIFYHSFGLTFDTRYSDPIDLMLLPNNSLGQLAVQSFFFLSGLFVAQSYFKDRNVIRFALRRIFRVWPGLFVCLIITALLACLFSSPSDFRFAPLYDGFYDYIVKNSCFDINWYINGTFGDHALSAINGPIHTLPLEMKMYLILGAMGALGLLANFRRIALISIILIIGCFATRVSLPGADFFFPAPYAHRAAAMFFAGVLTFSLSPKIYPKIWHGIILGTLAALCSGIAQEIFFFMALIWAIVYLGQLPLLARIGRPKQDLSYGIYIYGWPCQQFVTSVTSTHINPYLLTILALPVACLFAAASWRFVEKPAILLGHLLPSIMQRLHDKQQRATLSPSQSAATRLGVILLVLLIACFVMRSVSTTHDLIAVTELPVRIVDFGPKEGKRGASFNEQPDGASAIWMTVDSTPPDGTAIIFAGHKLDTSIGPKVVTAKIRPGLLSVAGEKSLFLEYRSLSKIERSNAVVLNLTN
ncbi:peptidoglycan/LPS O-acetylase OafA/YrhL [Paraburkholderia sp. GAS38]|uniref:acyltransferase family protein n=1 Tax=Paraburkholderia sp. GAS38 TaxID=3035133 RepID=UPI003D219CD2